MKEYTEKALQFEMQDYSIKTKNFNQDNVRILHGIWGLQIELGELEQALQKADKINIVEELGDCAWYLAIIADQFNITDKLVPNNKKPANQYDLTFIKEKVNLLADNLKKQLFYNKKLDVIKDFTDYIQDIYAEFINQFNETWLFSQQKNIDKLAKRYEDKKAFSNAKANNRNLTAEYNVLQR